MFTRHSPLHRPSPYPSWFIPTLVFFILSLVLMLTSHLLLHRWFLSCLRIRFSTRLCFIKCGICLDHPCSLMQLITVINDKKDKSCICSMWDCFLVELRLNFMTAGRRLRPSRILNRSRFHIQHLGPSLCPISFPVRSVSIRSLV